MNAESKLLICRRKFLYLHFTSPGCLCCNGKSWFEKSPRDREVKKKNKTFLFCISIFIVQPCRVVSSECFGTEDFYIFTKKPKTLAFSNNTLDCSWEPPISRHACGLTKCQVRRLKSSLG